MSSVSPSRRLTDSAASTCSSVANVNAAAAALRNWVVNLHKGAGRPRHPGRRCRARRVAGTVAVVPGFPTAMAEEVAPVYWELHTNRDQAERGFSASEHVISA